MRAVTPVFGVLVAAARAAGDARLPMRSGPPAILLGVVRDASGAILPGVTVSVTGPNIAGAQTTVTTRERQLPHRQSAARHLHGHIRAVRVQDRRARGPPGQPSAARSSRTSGSRSAQLAETVNVIGRVAGRRHDVERGRHDLRPGLGRPNAPSRRCRLLRSAGAGAGIGERRRRDGRRRAADDELRQLVRRKRLPARWRERDGQLLQRGILGAESRRDRRSGGAVARRAGRVRQPDGRRLQHRHQAGHQPVSRRRQRVSFSRTASRPTTRRT